MNFYYLKGLLRYCKSEHADTPLPLLFKLSCHCWIFEFNVTLVCANRFVLIFQWNIKHNHWLFTPAQKLKNHFYLHYSEVVYGVTLNSHKAVKHLSSFCLWYIVDGINFSPTVKVMKSSIFSYEQAWHRCVISRYSCTLLGYFWVIEFWIIFRVQSKKSSWICLAIFLH